MKTPTRYSIVQHSGFGYKGDTQFIRGLEVRAVDTKREQETVIRVGGLLFDSERKATEFEESASYPEGYTGLIPNAQGSFSDKKIDGLAIYIPVRLVTG